MSDSGLKLLEFVKMMGQHFVMRGSPGHLK